MKRRSIYLRLEEIGMKKAKAHVFPRLSFAEKTSRHLLRYVYLLVHFYLPTLRPPIIHTLAQISHSSFHVFQLWLFWGYPNLKFITQFTKKKEKHSPEWDHDHLLVVIVSELSITRKIILQNISSSFFFFWLLTCNI